MLTGYRRNSSRSILAAPPGRLTDAAGDSIDLSWMAPAAIFDQGQTGSCVGHARALGLYVASAAIGNPLRFMPSPMHIYRLARCYERANPGIPLADIGCDPVDSLDAVAKWGVRPMLAVSGRYSDADPSTVNDEPTLADLESGFKCHLSGDYQLASVPHVVSALAAGMPVCIDVMASGSTWQNYDGNSIMSPDWGATDHYVCLLGYRRLPGGHFVFMGRNSWGPDWGQRGHFWCDEDMILEATDMIACGGAVVT